jgi:hypothetical protein
MVRKQSGGTGSSDRFPLQVSLPSAPPFRSMPKVSGDVVNIKVLTDMDSHYSDSSGKGWVKAVRMAWRI